MSKLEETFMLLRADGCFYLLPLKYVERVDRADSCRERLLPAQMPGTARGGLTDGQQGEYFILLRMDEQNPPDGERGILADEASGIVRVPMELQFDLPRAAAGPENEWIRRAAFLKQVDEEILAFVLNPEKLGFGDCS